jgi:hypothetical protein
MLPSALNVTLCAIIYHPYLMQRRVDSYHLHMKGVPIEICEQCGHLINQS